MNKKRFSALRLILIVLVIVLLAGIGVTGERTLREPVEVRTLRKQQVTQSDEGHQEYYFGLLNEDEQRGYREILEGIRNFEEKFYLSLSGDDEIDRVYHAVLKDRSFTLCFFCSSTSAAFFVLSRANEGFIRISAVPL